MPCCCNLQASKVASQPITVKGVGGITVSAVVTVINVLIAGSQAVQEGANNQGSSA
jgi:hypothetical protein